MPLPGLLASGLLAGFGPWETLTQGRRAGGRKKPDISSSLLSKSHGISSMPLSSLWLQIAHMALALESATPR